MFKEEEIIKEERIERNHSQTFEYTSNQNIWKLHVSNKNKKCWLKNKSLSKNSPILHMMCAIRPHLYI